MIVSERAGVQLWHREATEAAPVDAAGLAVVSVDWVAAARLDLPAFPSLSCLTSKKYYCWSHTIRSTELLISWFDSNVAALNATSNRHPILSNVLAATQARTPVWSGTLAHGGSLTCSDPLLNKYDLKDFPTIEN